MGEGREGGLFWHGYEARGSIPGMPALCRNIKMVRLDLAPSFGVSVIVNGRHFSCLFAYGDLEGEI